MEGLLYRCINTVLVYFYNSRYIDDVFMTSNMSIDIIRTQFDVMNKKEEKHIQ
jgi:hypothetical protein